MISCGMRKRTKSGRASKDHEGGTVQRTQSECADVGLRCSSVRWGIPAGDAPSTRHMRFPVMTFSLLFPLSTSIAKPCRIVSNLQPRETAPGASRFVQKSRPILVGSAGLIG